MSTLVESKLFSARLVEGVAIGQSHTITRLIRSLTVVIPAYRRQSHNHQSVGCFTGDRPPKGMSPRFTIWSTRREAMSARTTSNAANSCECRKLQHRHYGPRTIWPCDRDSRYLNLRPASQLETSCEETAPFSVSIEYRHDLTSRVRRAASRCGDYRAANSRSP